jgi:hypothetical protein
LAIKFSPNGQLDISTDPMDLPAQQDGNDTISGAMTRCTNLHLDHMGIASTRRGSLKTSAAAMQDLLVKALIEQGGTRYAFSGTGIYVNEVSIALGLTDAQWYEILYNAYNVLTQSVFATNGTDRKRITGSNIQEWGCDAPTVAPVLAAGASGGLTGSYNAQYTYCRKEGTILAFESNPSPAAAAPQSVTSQKLSVTWAYPSDSQITHIRFYRTLTGAGTYYYWGESDLSNTTFSDDLADASLGTQVEIDHYRPPTGGIFLGGPAFSGCLFMGVGNNLYYSKPKQPEYWPGTYYIEVSPQQLPLKAIAFWAGQTFVANVSDIYMIQGTDPTSFFPLKMAAQCGTLSYQCFCPVVGQGIYHLSSEGIFLFKLATDINISENNFSPVFHGESRGSMPGMNLNYKQNCWMTTWRGKFYFGYPGTGETYPRNVISTELSSGRSVHMQFPFAIKTTAIDYTNQRLLAGCTDGYVRIIEEISITDDDGEPINWDIETMAFSVFKKYFPRYARYDVSPGVGTEINAFIKLNDVVQQTHPITTNRIIRKRLITGCTGDRLSVEITGSGIVDIYAAAVE